MENASCPPILCQFGGCSLSPWPMIAAHKHKQQAERLAAEKRPRCCQCCSESVFRGTSSMGIGHESVLYLPSLICMSTHVYRYSSHDSLACPTPSCVDRSLYCRGRYFIHHACLGHVFCPLDLTCTCLLVAPYFHRPELEILHALQGILIQCPSACLSCDFCCRLTYLIHLIHDGIIAPRQKSQAILYGNGNSVES